MATLVVQEVPRFGAGLGGVTWTAAAGAGDDFPNDSRTLVACRAQAGWTNETVQVEGVPAQDSARDGTATLDPQALNGVDIAGPFKGRNWNTGGSVQLTYPGGVTGLEVAALRITTG